MFISSRCAPAAVAVALAFANGRLLNFGMVTSFAALAPLVLLSGLAVVVAVGDRALLYRERLVSSAWAALLVAPPLLVVVSLGVMPWTFAKDVRIAQPAKTEAQFFADSYQRRIGKPPAFVTGDERLAPLIALLAPEPPAGVFRLGAAAQSVGERRRCRGAGRRAGLAGRKNQHAAGRPEDAISDHGAGTAALVRARGARPAAADPARLVGAAAARQLP